MSEASQAAALAPNITTDEDGDSGSGIHDFDFLSGSWRVHNRRLVKRLQNASEWEEFEAHHQGMPLLGGLGNMDELHDDRTGPIGMSLRFFNLLTKQWSIYWVSARDGILQPPVVGGFKDGIGIFAGTDEYEGTPIQVRFIWSNITPTNYPTTARWEQAFSTDHGQTWETNWIMEFTRSVE